MEIIWNECGILPLHFRGPSEENIEERVMEVCAPSWVRTGNCRYGQFALSSQRVLPLYAVYIYYVSHILKLKAPNFICFI